MHLLACHYTHVWHVNQHIWLSHCKYDLYSYYANEQGASIFSQIYLNTTNCNIYFTHYCPICARNKHDPQMPNICHICQLVHVHISDNQVSIYTSCELAAINCVTTSTGIHTSHIIGICPWTKYAYHIAYVYPSAFACSLHRPHITAHVNKKQQILTFIYHAIATYRPTTDIPIKCHVYAPYGN